MFYQVLPFTVVSQVAFRLLPIEVISMIFRYLDADSLLSAFSTSSRWAEICRGDPILRERIRLRIVQLRKERRRVLLDPSAGVVVHREEPSLLFGRNKEQMKQVSVNRNGMPVVPAWMPKFKKNSVGGPMRRKQNVRNAPYGKLRV